MTLHPCFQPASPQLPIPTPLHIYNCFGLLPTPSEVFFFFFFKGNSSVFRSPKFLRYVIYGNVAGPFTLLPFQRRSESFRQEVIMGSGCMASELREKPLCYYVTEKNRVLRLVNFVQQRFWGAAPRHFGSGTGQFGFMSPN